MSSTVRDRVAGSGLRFEDRGIHALKGLQDNVHPYTVLSTLSGSLGLEVREAIGECISDGRPLRLIVRHPTHHLVENTIASGAHRIT